MHQPASDPGPGAADLAQHRDYLYRYALLQLRDPARAEDVVQETLLAALENRSGFSGRATLKTWLTGILKHKIVDIFRAQAREAPAPGRAATPDPAELDEDEFAGMYFGATGKDHWHDPPRDWGDPERTLENKRFWETFEQCSQALSPKLARVFWMREIMGLETDEICKALAITPTNCWVLLYRARMTLRQCLEARWLSSGA